MDTDTNTNTDTDADADAEHGHEHRQSVPMVKSKLSSFAALEYLYKYFTPPTWPNEAHFKLVFGHWC